ncbi:MAG: precorrin-6y C5,15-methyltransferase (decarboxylating) subunit CbiE, partial [Pseudomonadota bacterium]
MNEMTPRASHSAAPERSARQWLHVVGIGDDGADGCLPTAASLIASADILAGAPRQLALVANSNARRIEITGDWRASIEALATHCGQRVVLLASGDPLLHGVGALVAEFYGPDEVRVVPHVSSFALVCARMLWSQPDVHLVRLTGAATDLLERKLRPGRRIVVLSANDASPRHVAAALTSRGYGASRIDIFEHLGGAHERCAGDTAASFNAAQDDRAIARLNTMAITCVADAATDRGLASLSSVPGLPEDAFEHDGQITKQEVRAITIARLAPQNGDLLWDIGLGSGAMAIEW